MNSESTFVTAINCMDGRVQEPIIDWMKAKYNVPYVDDITEAGPDCLVCSPEKGKLEGIKDRVGISVNKHGSSVIALSGHFDCAGNPVDKGQHIQDIRKSVDVVKSWGFSAEVIGLWVNENWEVEQIV